MALNLQNAETYDTRIIADLSKDETHPKPFKYRGSMVSAIRSVVANPKHHGLLPSKCRVGYSKIFFTILRSLHTGLLHFLLLILFISIGTRPRIPYRFSHVHPPLSNEPHIARGFSFGCTCSLGPRTGRYLAFSYAHAHA